MKKTVFIIMTAMLFAFCGCSEEEPVPKVFGKSQTEETIEEPKTEISEKLQKEEIVQSAEVFEEPEYASEWFFEPQSEYPLFLKEIFEAGTEVYNQADKTIENITVFGDENEFFVTFEYMAREGKKKEFNGDCWLRIYGAKTDDGKYIIERCGGGYRGEMNLEISDITVPDVWEGREAGYDAALCELVENLEPMEVFDTKCSFPQNVGEIFEILTGEDKSKLSRVEVFGEANEFFARYVYSSEIKDPDFLQIRVRVNNDGFDTLVAEGNGPMDYGLKKTDITLEDIQ